MDALTAPDHGETDATPAAEAVYWLRHPEIAATAVNTLTALLTSGNPNRSGPARQRPTELR
jgi:hypothetical protein